MKKILSLVLPLAFIACGQDHDHAHDHDHEHASPHHGIVVAFTGPDDKEAGHLEIKLHDDKGDIELWLASDARISSPHDLPLDAVVRVNFVARSKMIFLKPRNTTKNEDEDGLPNIRDGKTNYFIFPGGTGADASWLKGKAFKAKVLVSFQQDGKWYGTDAFELVPHTH